MLSRATAAHPPFTADLDLVFVLVFLEFFSEVFAHAEPAIGEVAELFFQSTHWALGSTWQVRLQCAEQTEDFHAREFQSFQSVIRRKVHYEELL